MYRNGERVMAWIAKIDKVVKHPDADSLDICTVGGWQCVTKLGEFKQGDLAVYISIDSWVPTELAPFLTKGKEPREYNGVKGERLRTIKLRGQLSQGLLLDRVVALDKVGTIEEGMDVTELLGIQKWERPIPVQLAGVMKGSFPSFIPKTDQERCQHLVNEIKAAAEAGLVFTIEEKLEGSSMTCYLHNGEFGVCSRNIDLKRDESNAFWAMAIKLNIEDKLRALGKNIAIQGELIGPGIQGNIYKLDATQFNVFDIYDIDAGKYLIPGDRRELTRQLGLFHVPVIEEHVVLDGDIQGLLEMADGESVLYPTPREGLVFKQVDGGMTFKVISNAYLLGEK